MNCLLALRPSDFLAGKFWQILSYGFLHATGGGMAVMHILMNMYALYALSKYIEPAIGKARFTLLYFVSLLGGGFMIVTFYLLTTYTGSTIFTIAHNQPTVGASGAIFGLLVLFGILYPDVHLLLVVFPVRAKYFAIVAIVVGIFLEQARILPISNAGHLGGALFGYVFYLLFLKQRLEFANLIPIDIYSEEEEEEEESLSGLDEMFSKQLDANQNLLDTVENMASGLEKEAFLQDIQVENANICPPATFSRDDSYCLRCEWMANCLLREIKDSDK